MRNLIQKRRLSTYIGVAGLLLYWRVSNGLKISWLRDAVSL